MPDLPAPETLADRRRRGTALLREPAPGGELTVLSTFNLDLFAPYLAEALDRHGVAASIHTAGFGLLAQQVADPGSELYARAPRDVLLVPAAEDLLAPLYEPGGAVDAQALAGERGAELRAQVETLLERLPDAVIEVVCLGARHAPAEHVLDPAAAQRGQAALERFDADLRALGDLGPRVIVVDFAWAAREHGWALLGDDRLWYLGRLRLSPAGHALLAELVAERVAVQRGVGRAKVAAVDLDDTLWGGVVGEVGAQGVEVGSEGMGLAFQDFQRELLRLKETGTLLVMCTKNDPEYALAAFDHPGMLLRREDFVAGRVNWEDKASNLRSIAEELGLGLDSFVFLDDNPRERDWVRQGAPEVIVPELPGDPVDRPRFLAAGPWFQTLAITEADRSRGADYHARGERHHAQAGARSFEDYLRSLQQRVAVEPVNERTMARAAQLCQKTNQFNLLTRRHTQPDVERMVADPAYDVTTVAVTDRFGDSGITGVGIVRHAGDEAEIDTFLLSCRVLGRRVEDAFLHVLAKRARARGARTLNGRYAPTDRNAQVARFFPDRGFAPAGDRSWTFDLEAAIPPPVPEISLEEPTLA